MHKYYVKVVKYGGVIFIFFTNYRAQLFKLAFSVSIKKPSHRLSSLMNEVR